jgi:hypothetical protein
MEDMLMEPQRDWVMIALILVAIALVCLTILLWVS